MKTRVCRNTLEGLVSDRLAAIGAANIPDDARKLVEADVWRACARTVHRMVTAPRVGRAVAHALAAPAAVSAEGSKGDEESPLASRWTGPKAQNIVAGHHPNSPSTTATADSNGAENLPEGEAA